MSEFRLRVGQSAAVRPRWWGKSWSVIFAGSLPDGTVSLAVVWTFGHNSAAYNLFLVPGQGEFDLPFGTGRVVERSRGEIHLRF